MKINLTTLLDDAECYRIIRQTRWTNGVCCPQGKSQNVIKRGKDDTQTYRQRYQCKGCRFHFDDLTDTIFGGHHQPLRKWIGCLYLMGLNLSSEQIAQELDLDKDDVYQMTMQLRQGIVDNNSQVQLSGEVECDEVYVTAGHKGQPEIVKKKDVLGGGTASKGFEVVALKKKKSHPSLG